MKYREIIKKYRQRPIYFLPVYADITGGVTTGILLSQLIHLWDEVFCGKEFYQTDDQLRIQTKLGTKEFRNAKDVLKKIGIVKAEVKGIPAKTWYTIDEDKIEELIINLENTNKTYSLTETDKLVFQDSFQFDRNGQTVLTETDKQINNNKNITTTARAQEEEREGEKVKPSSALESISEPRIVSPMPKPKRTKLSEAMEISDGWYSIALAEGMRKSEAEASLQKFIKHYIKHNISKTAEEWVTAVEEWCGNERNNSGKERLSDAPQDINFTPPMDDGTEAGKVLTQLYQKTDQKFYLTWIKDLVFKGFDNNELFFKCKNKYLAHQIGNNIFVRDKIINCLRDLFPSGQYMTVIHEGN